MNQEIKDLYDKLGEDGMEALRYLIDQGFTPEDYKNFLEDQERIKKQRGTDE